MAAWLLVSFSSATVLAVDVSGLEKLPNEKTEEVQRPLPRREHRARASRGAGRSPDEPVIVTVASGDSLQDIADQHGVTLQRLFDANPQVQDPNLVEAGLQLRIPKPDEELAHRPFPPPEPPVVPQPFSPAPVPAQPPPAPEPEFDGGVWDRLAQCESGGNWQANTGNGYYGGLQFSLSSWEAVGGRGYPHQASRLEQIARAKQLQAIQGWGAWPACSRKLGLR